MSVASPTLSLPRFTRVWRRRRHGRRSSRERRRRRGGGGGGGDLRDFFAFGAGGRTEAAACARMRAFSQKPKRDIASSNVDEGSFSFLRNLFDGRLSNNSLYLLPLYGGQSSKKLGSRLGNIPWGDILAKHLNFIQGTPNLTCKNEGLTIYCIIHAVCR